MTLVAVTPSTTTGPLSRHLRNKLEAAIILRGLVQLVLDQGPVEVLPRTWYREAGTPYLEARRRDSGERMVVRLDQIRDVRPY
jgi:hypothetical protein